MSQVLQKKTKGSVDLGQAAFLYSAQERLVWGNTRPLRTVAAYLTSIFGYGIPEKRDVR